MSNLEKKMVAFSIFAGTCSFLNETTTEHVLGNTNTQGTLNEEETFLDVPQFHLNADFSMLGHGKPSISESFHVCMTHLRFDQM